MSFSIYPHTVSSSFVGILTNSINTLKIIQNGVVSYEELILIVADWDSNVIGDGGYDTALITNYLSPGWIANFDNS